MKDLFLALVLIGFTQMARAETRADQPVFTPFYSMDDDDSLMNIRVQCKKPLVPKRCRSGGGARGTPVHWKIRCLPKQALCTNIPK